MVWVPLSHIRSQSHMDCLYCLLTRLPIPPAPLPDGKGVKRVKRFPLVTSH